MERLKEKIERIKHLTQAAKKSPMPYDKMDMRLHVILGALDALSEDFGNVHVIRKCKGCCEND